MNLDDERTQLQELAAQLDEKRNGGEENSFWTANDSLGYIALVAEEDFSELGKFKSKYVEALAEFRRRNIPVFYIIHPKFEDPKLGEDLLSCFRIKGFSETHHIANNDPDLSSLLCTRFSLKR